MSVNYFYNDDIAALNSPWHNENNEYRSVQFLTKKFTYSFKYILVTKSPKR